jgi:hypothetical protein
MTLLVTVGFATGCVRRTLTITSEPPGALCWINGREVGRTPVTIDFLHYGEYDVQLTRDGYEPLLTSGKADAPLWDTIPLDLVSEAVPGEPHSDIRWHYVLEPRLSDRDELIERADALRQKLASEAPIPPGGLTTQPGSPATAPPSPVPATEPAATTAETTPSPGGG